jgi:hypothetical protein
MNGQGDEGTRWRGELRRDVALLIALKVAALTLLWGLFFAPRERLTVDGAGASRQLGLTLPHDDGPRQFAAPAAPPVPERTP